MADTARRSFRAHSMNLSSAAGPGLIYLPRICRVEGLLMDNLHSSFRLGTEHIVSRFSNYPSLKNQSDNPDNGERKGLEVRERSLIAMVLTPLYLRFLPH